MTTLAAETTCTHPWLRPAVPSLLGLTDDRPDAIALMRDPGLVLHVLRYSRPTASPRTFEFDANLLLQPGLCDTAAAILERESTPAIACPELAASGLRLAKRARELAHGLDLISADAAWCLGLLAGYYSGHEPHARRQFAQWRLPSWVTVTIGFPELGGEHAERLGGDAGLHLWMKDVREAVWLDRPPVDPMPKTEVPNAILARMLRLASKARARSAAGLVRDLEGRIERLTATLAETQAEFDGRLRDAKLDALAEFAAGASHEINNPLAVISTSVQLLRSEEDEEDRLDRYDSILRQTKRIHELLHGARQFARPTEPIPTLLALSSWCNGVARECEPIASASEVSLELPPKGTPGRIWADATQLRTIVIHLVKNAIEAAGPGGWVRVTQEADGSTTRIVVEDSGDGPPPRAQRHMFDPFYSGREAGRGRGLGLPIAWQLARKNGGELRYDHAADGPTRFVLTLPAIPNESFAVRKRSA